MNDMSPEYKKALETVNEASRVFSRAQKAYRTREIGDEEFLAAKAIMAAAETAFDAAYAKETNPDTLK